MASSFGRPKLPKRLSFNLADTFAGNIELLTNLLQSMLALAANAEPQTDDLLFFRRQCLQNVSRFIPDLPIEHRSHGRSNPAIFNQIAESRFTVPADRSFQRHRVT